MSSFAPHFSRFLSAVPGRLHVAAHSHHPWPDVTYGAHAQAWLDAAELADGKWHRVLHEVLPEAQRHVAARLGLSDPATLAFAPNTHSLLMRLLSCLPKPIRILTTDAEFLSFDRQVRRLEEDGQAVVERIPAEPFPSFPDRLSRAAARGGRTLVFFSHVHFDSGYVTPDLPSIVAAVDGDAVVVVDGYHGFMAVPTDLSAIEHRAFYLAGGYKYAMAGEGACFLHCPPGACPRPPDTGWFAGFSALDSPRAEGAVPYAADGSRFSGATFDPTALYRFNAVQRWLDEIGVTVGDIHAHVGRLQRRLLGHVGDPWRMALVPGISEASDRGHFLTFRLPDASAWQQRLADAGVIVDHRSDRLRIGLGLYHNDDDVDELWRRMEAVHRPGS